MLRVVVIEDEPLAAQFLAALIERTGKAEVVGTARDGNWGLALCQEKTPDAAFLDVQMPGPDGIELASQLARLEKPPLVVFTTGHRNRACDAFRLEAVDYLVKPIDPAQVAEALYRLEARLMVGPQTKEDNPSSLGLLDGRLPVKNPQDDIVRLLSRWEILAALRRDRRTWIHTSSEEFATYYRLADLLEWLGDPPFLRVSRESIVNLQAVEEVVHYGDRLYQVRIRDRLKTQVDASRSGAASISRLLKPPI